MFLNRGHLYTYIPEFLYFSLYRGFYNNFKLFSLMKFGRTNKTFKNVRGNEQ